MIIYGPNISSTWDVQWSVVDHAHIIIIFWLFILYVIKVLIIQEFDFIKENPWAEYDYGVWMNWGSLSCVADIRLEKKEKMRSMCWT